MGVCNWLSNVIGCGGDRRGGGFSVTVCGLVCGRVGGGCPDRDKVEEFTYRYSGRLVRVTKTARPAAVPNAAYEKKSSKKASVAS
ncbi:unnamed protein product [Mesocestoides corti]|uniref:Uncharacterized protein n=1 Tax=Mesocestoides corti TaxID=53468 RepID=A0A0R3UCC7_MESCO|nr:unnamed protein product [Mesocestoides corti]